MRRDSSGASTREFPQHSFVYSYADDGTAVDCHAGGHGPAEPLAVNGYSERDLLLPAQQQRQQNYQQQQQQQQQQYYYYQQQQQYEYPVGPPPSAPAFPPSAYYVPPPAPSYQQEEEIGSPGFVRTTLKLIVFHLLNSVLGIAAFVVVVTGGSLSVGLVPLCCFGVVVFRVLLLGIRYLAQLDVQLCNFISEPIDRVLVKLPSDSSRFAGGGHALLRGRRLAPRLGEMSPLAFMAVLYFSTIKFALGIASIIAASLCIAVPATVVGAMNGGDVTINVGVDPDYMYTLQDDPLAFAVANVCLFVISLALMHLVAWLSCVATRFFCSEKFMLTQFYFSSGSDVGVPVATSLYTNGGYGSGGI